MNSTITEIKNVLEGINSRIFESEGLISELEDKMVQITSGEQNKVKQMKRTEDSLRDLWDHIESTNIRIIGVPEEEQRRQWHPTPVLLPGKSHGPRSLVGCSLWGR